MKTLNSKSKISTKVLKTLTLDKKNKVTIEKILGGEHKGQYTVKSYAQRLFGLKSTSLASYNIDTDFNGNKIVKIEYPIFKLVRQAEDWLREVKNNRYAKK